MEQERDIRKEVEDFYKPINDGIEKIKMFFEHKTYTLANSNDTEFVETISFDKPKYIRGIHLIIKKGSTKQMTNNVVLRSVNGEMNVLPPLMFVSALQEDSNYSFITPKSLGVNRVTNRIEIKIEPNTTVELVVYS